MKGTSEQSAVARRVEEAAVLAWALRQHGARRACVPVVADNMPALALYRGLGFDREVLPYHYRRRKMA